MGHLQNDSNSTYLLQKLNDEKAIVIIPAIVFTAFLMLTGLIGNIAVCYYYGCKTKRSTISCFILSMAILDLFSCTISMPMEIVNLRFLYMFPDATLCKVLKVTSFVLTISSRLILVAIAMERYRRICLPFRKQFTVFQARLICCISVLIGCILSWPTLVFYTVVVVDVPNSGSEVVQGYACTRTTDDFLKVYLNAFNVMYILLFIFTVLPLTVLYALVCRELIRRKRFWKYGTGDCCISPKPSMFLNNDNCSPGKSNEDNDAPSRCHNDVREEHTKLGEHNSANNNESILTNELKQTNTNAQLEEQCDSTERSGNEEDELTDGTTRNLKKGNIGRVRPEYIFDKKMATDSKNVRNTLLMLAITMTFVVSFLPFMYLIVWRGRSARNVENEMTDLQLIFYTIGIRSVFLSCAMNPMIYGFFNSQFRDFFARRFRTCCGAKSIFTLDKKTRDKIKSNK